MKLPLKFCLFGLLLVFFDWVVVQMVARSLGPTSGVFTLLFCTFLFNPVTVFVVGFVVIKNPNLDVRQKMYVIGFMTFILFLFPFIIYLQSGLSVVSLAEEIMRPLFIEKPEGI
ncbi:hypothetical protein CHM34_04110 [Paludifilum halophilum]|uniref:Uncharacterized protein n=1 Tax=Paludifilum halophilum TaxID=1642702 RepID=A0A235B9J3_9BACL|nr:hypothetical protein CHM34_04110 [Paludifilum halophilum]